MATNAITSRAQGAFPISIATSLAIEGSLGVHPDRPMNTRPLLDYNVVWVNLKTVFRNLYNAIERDEVLSISPDYLLQAFVDELEQLQDVIHSETQGKVGVEFYTSDYLGMELKYPKAILRGDSTPLQKAYTNLMKAVLGPFVKTYREQLKLFTLKVNLANTSKVLMLTHFPYDLFAKDQNGLALLESHTGVVKLRHQWYTKYLNGKELQRIPFREDMIQIFGDNEHFRPQSLPMRKRILDLSEKYDWTQATQTSKILYGVNSITDDPFMRDTLRSMIK